jgi:hypothetical protein
MDTNSTGTLSATNSRRRMSHDGSNNAYRYRYLYLQVRLASRLLGVAGSADVCRLAVTFKKGVSRSRLKM